MVAPTISETEVPSGAEPALWVAPTFLEAYADDPQLAREAALALLRAAMSEHLHSRDGWKRTDDPGDDPILQERAYWLVELAHRMEGALSAIERRDQPAPQGDTEVERLRTALESGGLPWRNTLDALVGALESAGVKADRRVRRAAYSQVHPLALKAARLAPAVKELVLDHPADEPAPMYLRVYGMPSATRTSEFTMGHSLPVFPGTRLHLSVLSDDVKAGTKLVVLQRETRCGKTMCEPVRPFVGWIRASCSAILLRRETDRAFATLPAPRGGDLLISAQVDG